MTAARASGRPSQRRKSWLPVAAVTAGTSLQRGFGALLPLTLAIIATRAGGFEAAGVVGVCVASALLVAAASDLGISQAAIRDFPVIAPGRDDIYSLIRTKLMVATLAAGVLAAGALLRGSETWALPLAISALAVPPFAATSLLTSKLATDGDGGTLALGAVFGFLAGVITAVAAAVVSDEPWTLLSAFAVARTVEAVLLFSGVRIPRFASRGAYGAGWIARAWPLSIVGLLQIAYLRGQIIIPGSILDGDAAGQVVDGFNLYSAATLLPGALGLAAWPAISRAAAQSPEAATRLAVRFGLVNLALVAVPVGALLVAPGFISEVLYGETNSSLEQYVRWGAIATLFIAPNAVMMSLALSLSRERAVAGSWLVGLAASAAMTAALTSRFGVTGAGFAVAASELVLCGLLAWCVSPAVRTGTASALLEPRVAAVGAGLFAGIVAGGATPFLSSPTPSSGFLPLLALPFLAVAAIAWMRYEWTAPLPVFVITWTLALGIAQLPLFPEFNWTRETWLLLTVPPAALALGAVAASGRSGWSNPPIPQRLKRPPVSATLVAACALAGTAGWALYFARIGTIPLVSDQIDVARFQSFGLTTLVGTRLGYVAVVAALPGFALAQSRRDRVIFAIAGAAALAPMALSGGRLYPFSAVAIGAFAAILLRGLSFRLGMFGIAAAALLVAGSSAIFFIRVDQQPENAFKTHLNTELRPTRPEVLHWTIPVQMAASVSMHTLSDLTQSHAHEAHEGDGLYSTKFVDRFIPSRDLEQVTRPTARFAQVTTTYVGPWYADFGFSGALALSILWGLASGLVWRWWKRAPSPLTALLYAYAAFWLVYAIYLNYWTVHGVWLADVLFIFLLTLPFGRLLTRARGLAGRYEAPRVLIPEPAVATGSQG